VKRQHVYFGAVIAVLFVSQAGQAIALTALDSVSCFDEDDRGSLRLLVQDRFFDERTPQSPGGLSQNQRSLLQNLLNLPDLTDREKKVFRDTLQRNTLLATAAEDRLRRYLRERLDEIEREQEQHRIAEIERQRLEEEEQRRAVETERLRREEEQQRVVAIERQRLEEAQRRAAEAERLRHELERQRIAEIERQRLKEEQQRVAVIDPTRQEGFDEQPKASEPKVLTHEQQKLLTDLIGMAAMSSTEKAILRKFLTENQRLSSSEEKRLKKRYAALKATENLKFPSRVEENDVAVFDSREQERDQQEASESDSD